MDDDLEWLLRFLCHHRGRLPVDQIKPDDLKGLRKFGFVRVRRDGKTFASKAGRRYASACHGDDPQGELIRIHNLYFLTDDCLAALDLRPDRVRFLERMGYVGKNEFGHYNLTDKGMAWYNIGALARFEEAA